MPGLLGFGTGLLAAGGSAAPLLLDGISGVTLAWSVSRKLKRDFLGGFYTDTGSLLTIFDQSGLGSRNIVSASAALKPAVSPQGTMNQPGVVFNADRMTGPTFDVVRNSAPRLVAPSAAYILMSCRLLATTAGELFMDGEDQIGIQNSTTNIQFVANTSVQVSVAYSANTDLVVEIKHDGVNTKGRVNLGTWASAAEGALSLDSDRATWGRDGSKVIFECVCFDSIPSDEVQDALAADMYAWIHGE